MVRSCLTLVVLGLVACSGASRVAAPRPPAGNQPVPDAAVTPPAGDEPAAPDAAAMARDLPPAVDLVAAADLVAAGPEGRSAGCTGGEGAPEGQATIAVGGATRTYILRLPAGYTAQRAWPLVLALHPNGGAGIGFWDAASGARSIRALARDRAIVVLPLARPAGGGFDWRGDLPSDLAYFDALISSLEGKLCIDTRHIFAMGFSGGGSFSGVLACRRHDIRAFAAGSAVPYYDPKDCGGASAAWITVGADELIDARKQFRDDWVTRNACQPATTPGTPPDCQAYACPAQAPVIFCVHPGGHLWPDYGTQAAWTFFSQL